MKIRLIWIFLFTQCCIAFAQKQHLEQSLLKEESYEMLLPLLHRKLQKQRSFASAYNLGITYYRKGDYKQGNQFSTLAKQYADTEAQRIDAQKLGLASAFGDKNMEQAVRIAEELLSSAPSNPDYQQFYAMAVQAKQQEQNQGQGQNNNEGKTKPGDKMGDQSSTMASGSSQKLTKEELDRLMRMLNNAEKKQMQRPKSGGGDVGKKRY